MGGAAELVQIMARYGVLEYRQLLELRPQKSESVKNQIAWLAKNKRLYRDNLFVKARPELNPDAAVITAFWVLLDFIHIVQVEYHTKSDFPAVINFFAGEESYDIIVISPGSENLICHAVMLTGRKEDSKRIVVVEDAQQIEACRIPGAFLYCTVSAGGQVHYYQKGVDER